MTTAPPLLHRHTDHETGHILRIDPATGEVKTRRVMIRPKSQRAAFNAWADKRRADESLRVDAATAHSNLPEPVFKLTQAIPTESKRGRPKAVTVNPVAAYMHLLADPFPFRWVEDIVAGSITTSAGVSNGKNNVKTQAVMAALYAPEITTASCSMGVAPRTAQRIAKAARHAAHGIASFVDRHPEVKATIDAELAVEALFRLPD